MSSREFIGEVKKIGGGAPTHHVEEPISIAGKADKAQFDAALEQKKTPQQIDQIGQKESDTKTIYDVSQASGRIDPTHKASLDEIKTQIDKTLTDIKGIKNDLETPNLDLHIRPYKQQLRNKLTHIDENLQIALSKSGVEPIEEAERASAKIKPIEQFVGRLSHIEYQMEDMGNYLSYMASAGLEMSPANTLAMQIKVTHIGQEVEFFSSLLKQVIESAKTIMNIQV